MLLHHVVRWLAVAGMGTTTPAVSAPHDVHLTHARMVVEGRSIVVRVRFFHDDLAKAINAPAGLTSGAAYDSLIARYAAGRFVVSADGQRLATRLTGSGQEPDASSGQRMQWVVLEMKARRPAARIVVRDALLFDTFPDQQNILVALRMPGERRQSLYFVKGKSEVQELR